MEKNNRIAITGPSGVGKTTLAKFISEEYGIEFVSASARDVWPRFGFQNHAEALSKCLRDPNLGLQYQEHILINRHKALSARPVFVTDRSPIDNYAYFLLQQGYNSELHNKYMKDLCLKDYDMVDTIIYITLGEQDEIENNGRRICNMSYQRMVDSVIYMVLMEEFGSETLNKELIVIDTWNLASRKEIIRERLK